MKQQCESELIKFIILRCLRNGGIHFSRLYGTDQVRHISPVLGKIVIDILCGCLESVYIKSVLRINDLHSIVLQIFLYSSTLSRMYLSI